MSYVAEQRHGLLIPTGDENHLFVVMNDACKDLQHLLISITSIKDGKYHDPACVLSAGEHSFIVRPSYLYYKVATLRHRAHLSKCVEGGVFLRREDFSQPVFQRICAGLNASTHTPPWALTYFGALSSR